MYKFITLMPEFHGSRALGEFSTLKEAYECGLKEGCTDKECQCNRLGFNIKALLENGEKQFVKLIQDEGGRIHGMVWLGNEEGDGGDTEIDSFRP